MAALPAGALPLPVSAPAKLSLLFANASKDPTGGNWDALIVSFLHNPCNGSANTDTNTLFNMVITLGVHNKLLSFIVMYGDNAPVYTLCTKY